MWLVRYIHLNPVRAKICTDIKQWQWVGHGEYCGQTKNDLIDHGVVTELFGVGAAGRASYIEFIAEGLSIASKYDEDLHPSESAPFLGSAKFIDEVAYKVDDVVEGKRKNIKDIIDEQLKGSGITREMVQGKCRKKNIAHQRKKIIGIAFREYRYSVSELARYMNCSEAYVSRVVS